MNHVYQQVEQQDQGKKKSLWIPTQVKCRLLISIGLNVDIFKNLDIFLNEFPAYFGKCKNFVFDVSQNMLEIHSKICNQNVEMT